ncbi:BlaI/MecI/CopY family transcriptional regulator [Streptomyces sp. 8L]|uniref:BlaI/MecI/CopY family transcriptional regulator n=1 Tax=Streptomyces sp. 8L TaxID=2877242 RepID=UPI0035A9428E
MGDLESAVLAVLWAAPGPLTARRVQEDLPMPLARTTVATLLARLYEKGAVVRERAGRGYAYAAAQDRQGLTARRMHRELDRDADREVVLARFVSQLGPEDERILRELLETETETDTAAETETEAEPGTAVATDAATRTAGPASRISTSGSARQGHADQDRPGASGGAEAGGRK